MQTTTRASTCTVLIFLVAGAGCTRVCARSEPADGDGSAVDTMERAAADGAPSARVVEPWLLGLGGEGEDEGLAVAAGQDGTVVVAGVFSGVVDPDGAGSMAPWRARGGSDAFVAAWSAGGELRWARTLGGAGEDRGHAVAVALDGSVIVAGRFQGAVEIDHGGSAPVRLQSRGSSDAFVLRLDRDGAFQWVKTLGGSGWVEALALAAAPGDGVLIGGRFAGTVDLDPGEDTDQHTAAGDVDGFAVMLTRDGELSWARAVGGAGLDEVQAVAVSDLGSAVVGHFSGDVDFDRAGAHEQRLSQGFTDVFVVRLAPDGALRWVRTWGGAFVDQAHGVGLTDEGEVVVAGLFVDAVSFDPASEVGERRSVGRGDVFLVALSPDGSLRWVRTLGGPSSDYVYGLALGPGGEVVATGRFQGSVDFDPDEGRIEHVSRGEDQRPDGFVLGLDRDGRFLWTMQVGGPGLDRGRSVTIGAGGAVVVTGAFEDTLDLPARDPDQPSVSSRGAADVFVLQRLPFGAATP